MSVGILIITHGGTGAALIEEAGFVLGQALENVNCLALNQSGDLPASLKHIRAAMEQSHTENGLLVLTDLLGASPANLVAEILDEYHAIMVTGINLGMLIRVCNYRDNPLELVARKAVGGGRSAVKIFQA
jgi:PTS system ascorbate-specific IIA component